MRSRTSNVRVRNDWSRKSANSVIRSRTTSCIVAAGGQHRLRTTRPPAVADIAGGGQPGAHLTMLRARDVYELRRDAPPRKGRIWRRLRQITTFVTLLESIAEGGERLMIVNKTTDETVGELRQRFANEFYDTKIREDLLTLSASAFAEEWISARAI